jgi:hypothetical protein
MKADYGIDAPGVVRNFALAGVAALVAGWFVFSAGGHVPGGFLLAASLIFFVESGWMLFSSRKGKWLMRERLLDLAGLTGHEQVLDVGCGRGLILNGAARRLTAGGRAIGIDLWSRKDQSGNHPESVKIPDGKAWRNGWKSSTGMRGACRSWTGNLTSCCPASAFTISTVGKSGIGHWRRSGES